MRATLVLVVLAAGCYDLGALSKHFDGGVDQSVVIGTPDGGATTLSIYAGMPGGGGSANGTGTGAFFDSPTGVAADANNFYVVDQASSVIFAVDRASLAVTRISGNPYRPGYGDTTLNGPSRAVVLGDTLYVSDTGNNLIRALENPTVGETLQNVAGTPIAYNTCAVGSLAEPIGLATDGASTLYIASSSGNELCEVDLSTGMLTLLAGSETAPDSFGYADGPGFTARFSSPTGIAYQPANASTGTSANLFVFDLVNRLIRSYDLGGNTLSSYAGTYHACGSKPGPPILDTTGTSTTTAQLCNIWDGVVINGSLYFSDSYVQTIRWIDPTQPAPTQTIQQLAGMSQTGGFANGAGSAAAFAQPQGMTAYKLGDGSDAMLVADSGNHTVRSITIPGGVVTTIAGSAENAGDSTRNGDRTSVARFHAPLGLATDGKTVYVADSENSAIRLITGNLVNTLALPNGTLVSPSAIAVASDGGLYIADQATGAIVYVPNGGAPTTFVGAAPNTDGGSPVDGGSGALLARPSALALGSNALYVADTNHGVVRIFDLAGVFQGNLDLGHDSDANIGCGTGTGILAPAGLALDATNDVLYVASRESCVIVRVDLTGKTAPSILAGGAAGSNDGVGLQAQFDHPTALALDDSGHLFVIDRSSATIRSVDLASKTVTTLAGTPNQAGIVPGPLPAQLNRGWGLTWLKGVGLIASMPSENALVVIQ